MPNHELSGGQKIVWQWMESIEASTRAAAQTAGLYEHATTIGDIREFVIKDFLTKFLPNSVSVGTGQIFTIEGTRSKQIDIVISDSHYPSLRSETGSALFPAESVIATIEVKSTLDKNSLEQALDNQMSVLNLGINLDRSVVDNETHRVSWYNPNSHQILSSMISALMPRTYIIGMTGFSQMDTVRDRVGEWREKRHKEWLSNKLNATGTPKPSPRPSTIVTTNKIVAFSPLDLPHFRPGKPVLAENQAPPPQELDLIFAAYEFANQFSFIACDLISAISRRYHATIPNSYALSASSYFSLGRIFNAHLHELTCAAIITHPGPTPPSRFQTT